MPQFIKIIKGKTTNIEGNENWVMMKNSVLDKCNQLVQNDSRLIPGASPSAGEGQIYPMVKNELKLLKYYYMHTI